MAIIQHRKFICADANANNNKFWEYLHHDDGTTIFKYGRIGSTSTTETRSGLTQKDIDKKVREKVNGRPGKAPYREIEVISDIVPAKNASKSIIKEAATSQLAGGNTALSSLIDRLVEANKHELYTISGGKLSLDVTTGVISTPVGIVSKDMILQARDVLDKLVRYVPNKDFDNKSFIDNINSYLMLIPQKVGHAKGWHRDFFVYNNSIAKQTSLLDQLESSANLALNSLKTDDGKALKQENIFATKLEILSDKKEIDRITKFFYATLNSSHTSKNLKPKNFYVVKHEPAAKAFESDGAKISNHQQLWHGTRIFNVLSILKNGLKMPKTMKTMAITGSMFGDGIYFSDQSTKSLNYSQGYWSGARETNCFMFLFDVACGKQYVPKSSYESLPKPGYDSTFAMGGKSGVLNNEMVIYRESQCNPRFLIEFE